MSRDVDDLLRTVTDLATSFGVAVVFALTVPHLVVVALLDRRQLRHDRPLRHP